MEPKSKIGPDKNGFVRRKERQEWDLKEVHLELIKERKEKGKKRLKIILIKLLYFNKINFIEEPRENRTPRLLKKVPKQVPRPETPTSFAHPQDYQKVSNSITLFFCFCFAYFSKLSKFFSTKNLKVLFC